MKISTILMTDIHWAVVGSTLLTCTVYHAQAYAGGKAIGFVRLPACQLVSLSVWVKNVSSEYRQCKKVTYVYLISISVPTYMHNTRLHSCTQPCELDEWGG